jgi:hypothetical protein
VRLVKLPLAEAPDGESIYINFAYDHKRGIVFMDQQATKVVTHGSEFEEGWLLG